MILMKYFTFISHLLPFILTFILLNLTKEIDAISGYHSSHEPDPDSHTQYGQIDTNSTLSTRCQPAKTPLCNIQSYLTVQPFRNTLGYTEQEEAIGELHKYTYLFRRQPCSSYIQLFLCSLYVPVCVKSNVLEDVLLLPCRDDCEKARKYCINDLQKVDNGTWPAEWNCNKFNYHEHDKLCVINNANQTTIAPSTLYNGPVAEADKPGLDSTPALPTGIHISNETVCGDDLFDCRIMDPSRNMNALCIDRRWVCDGKKDCLIDGDYKGNSLDEDQCEEKCRIGERYCDGKCISRSDICDGKVDCSSGIDEQDCYDYLTGLIQSILCIFALFSAVYLLIRFLRFGDQKANVEELYTGEHIQPANKNLNRNLTDSQHFIPNGGVSNVTQPLVDEDITSQHLNEHLNVMHKNPPLFLPDVVPITQQPFDEKNMNQHLNDFLNPPTTQRCPIYHEPTYSIMSRNDYERLNAGGYSGASSVYASYGAYQPHFSSSMSDVHREPPAAPPAPPPTPALSGSMTKIADLYENLNSPHKPADLLD